MSGLAWIAFARISGKISSKQTSRLNEMPRESQLEKTPHQGILYGDSVNQHLLID